FVTRAPESVSVPTRSRIQRVTGQPAVIPSPLRTFPPGSEWLYIKLYAGSATLEHVLLDTIMPLVWRAAADDVISQWFFIRYSQPSRHLRIRFNGEPQRLTKELLPRLQHVVRPLMERRELWKMELDTYDRELERYGGIDGTRCAERMFCADSEAVAAMLEHLPEAGPDGRLTAAIVGVDRLLSDCRLSTFDCQSVVQWMRDMVYDELRVKERARKRLSEKFRLQRASLESALKPSATDVTSSGSRDPVWSALDIRSERMAPIVSELHALRTNGGLTCSVSDLAASYAHMYVNRLMLAEARAQELMVYDFL